jgi:signal transduction histidine kinase
MRFDFGLLMTCAGAWAVCIGIFFITKGSHLNVLHVNYVVALMMVYCLAAFSVRLDGRKSSLVKTFHIVGLLFSSALAIVLAYDSTWLISSVNFVSTNSVLVSVSNPGYFLYGTAFSTAYIISVLYLVNAVSRSLGSERNKYIQILISILIVGFTGLVTNLYLPSIGNYTLIWAAPALVIFVVLTSSISIVRYKTFDIKLAAVRSAAYALSLLVLALIYYAIAYIASTTLFQGKVSNSFSISPLNILLALLLAFIFQPIKNSFDKLTDRIFFRDRYKSDEFYRRLSEVLTTTTDLRNLLQRAAQEIGTTLKAEQAFFFLQYDEGKRHITAGTKDHKDLPLDDVESINAYVQTHGDQILVTQLLENDSKLKRVLVSHKIALLMPLMHHDKTVGYLALGEQKSSGYTNRDIKVLKTISDELIIAIQNALSVQEVRMINASLEQRIEMATAELRTSNARLKRLDASKDEFLSMASHQLRTPLTSVKGYLSMMIDGDVGKISAMQKQVLEEAFSSSERMVHLIHDFLNVSRLQTGKFMLELSDVNLAELIQQEVDSLEKVASSHSMKLEFKNTAGDVHLQIDDTKIRQVVMNYIDNAIYYSHPDSTIFIELSKTEKDVILEIKDTGIGVPKSEQEQLFSKFYRASNARKQRPDGTGVGIFLAKKVITALGGDIVFRSKEGKGSVFGFTLPLDQDVALLENNPKQLGK